MENKRLLTPLDIIWIKNVTNKEIGSAYMDVGTEFILHFPNHHGKNVLAPKMEEIIILYQNIKGEKVFTHLVTPVDESMEMLNNENFSKGRRVRVIAKVPIDRLINVSKTRWSSIKFQPISQGNVCRISNIKQITSNDEFLKDVWDNFKEYFKEESQTFIRFVDNASAEIDLISPGMSVNEGKERLITHLARERDQRIISVKKMDAIKRNKLRCSVCQYSFIENWGIEFMECHHIKPISESGETITRLIDLELVCSNCHRMLHRKINGAFLTLDQLKDIYTSRKCVEYNGNVSDQ